MSAGDLQRLPPAVMVAFVALIWPALWAAAAIVGALATDVLRDMRQAVRFTGNRPQD